MELNESRGRSCEQEQEGSDSKVLIKRELGTDCTHDIVVEDTTNQLAAPRPKVTIRYNRPRPQQSQEHLSLPESNTDEVDEKTDELAVLDIEYKRLTQKQERRGLGPGESHRMQQVSEKMAELRERLELVEQEEIEDIKDRLEILKIRLDRLVFRQKRAPLTPDEESSMREMHQQRDALMTKLGHIKGKCYDPAGRKTRIQVCDSAEPEASSSKILAGPLNQVTSKGAAVLKRQRSGHEVTANGGRAAKKVTTNTSKPAEITDMVSDYHEARKVEMIRESTLSPITGTAPSRRPVSAKKNPGLEENLDFPEPERGVKRVQVEEEGLEGFRRAFGQGQVEPSGDGWLVNGMKTPLMHHQL
jgi:hypothetical protein